MSKILSLDDHRAGWRSWWAVCLECGHLCVSVQLDGASKFVECSACGQMRMVRTAPAE